MPQDIADERRIIAYETSSGSTQSHQSREIKPNCVFFILCTAPAFLPVVRVFALSPAPLSLYLSASPPTLSPINVFLAFALSPQEGPARSEYANDK